jgi:IclR family transcriptional regulator, KDG regulon repressor
MGDRRRKTSQPISKLGSPKASSRKLPQRLSSVANAVRLLKCFTEDEADLGITALSNRLGIAKSSAHRLATTLLLEGLLEQNSETERYRLGLSLFGLGALVRQRMNVATEARPILFELRESTDETVHLAVLDDSEIVYVLNLESNQAIRMRADLGARKPAFCTAEGRAMLAFQPQPVVDKILSRKLLPRTIKTDTDPLKISKALEKIRKTGYAQEDEQSEAGMRSIAAPIWNAEGRTIAALGLAGPTQRLPDTTLLSYAPLIVNAAKLISKRLGYSQSGYGAAGNIWSEDMI